MTSTLALTVKTIENPNGAQEQTCFIPAYLEDNQIGMNKDPGYEARLMSRDPTTARALRLGDWDVFAGQLLKEFSRAKHVIRPADIPLEWTRLVGIDWGFAEPFSAHWAAINPVKKRVIIYRELYRTGLTDPYQAQLIKEHTLPGEKIAFYYADPSMWTRRTTELIAKSTADVYLDNGILLTRADNDHRMKLARIRGALAPIYDERPGLLITDDCPNLIRTLQALMSDPKHPEEILPGQEEHAFDSLAYLLSNYIPPAVLQEKPKEKQINPWFTART